MFPFPTDDHSLLTGVRVVDAARILAGPFCGQVLADLGAEVIKLERPGRGDDTRGWGPPYLGELSAYFLSCNRGKRSVTLDIAADAGREVFHKLLDSADILIENFRSDSAEKLGLAPENLLARHPRLIVCSISGYGRTGPLRLIPGYDFAVQALSGLMGVTGPVDGPPCKVGVAVTDVITGLYATTSILACLHARKTSGHGYAIDLALLDCALASQVNLAQAYLTSGTVPARQGNAHLQIVPYELFETADGYLVLNVGNDAQWQAFCEAVEAPELANDARFATNRGRVELRQEVVPRVAALMKARLTAEWEKRLVAANVPHAVVCDYAKAFASEQVAARGMKVIVRDPSGAEVDLVGNPVHVAGGRIAAPVMPPRLGQQTDEVLQALGLTAEEVKALRSQGVV